MWRIWYSDGSTYSSDDGLPETVPGYGVQAIAQPDRTEGIGNVSYLVLAGYDFYAWHLVARRWFGMMGESSAWNQILMRRPVVGMASGLWIPDEEYEAIKAEAQAWADERGMRPKDGRRPEERP